MVAVAGLRPMATRSQPASGRRRRVVVVVGAGIAGLAAAWQLREAEPGLHVVVLEAAPQIGGKLVVSDVGGIPVDEGAESLLARRPEAVELVQAVGLGDALVHPLTTAAAMWTRGALRPVPEGTVMGIPGDLVALARSGVLSPRGLARVALDRALPGAGPDRDVAVGRYVAQRMGSEVVDRLVEPMLGGVYAGHADRLSLAATVPALWATLRQGGSLLQAAGRVRSDNGPSAVRGPAFAGLDGGLGRLPGAVARASGALVRTGVTVRALEATATGWRLVTGPVPAPKVVDADAVVLAVPAGPAGRLLAATVPAAAAELALIDYASMAVVTLVYPGSAFARRPRGSGFLVPPVEARTVKAATFSSSKWGWVARQARREGDLVVVRASIGRQGEEAVLQRSDVDLVDAAAADLAEATGVTGSPVAARVTRWGGGLPQYAVGHLDRVARVRTAVAGVSGLAVCGAAYDGVGVAACVASASLAATRVLKHLRDPAGSGARMEP